MNKKHTLNTITLAVCAALSNSVVAQEAVSEDTSSKEKYEQIVVTATPGGTTMRFGERCYSTPELRTLLTHTKEVNYCIY
ncbi:MAG: hypothetical protein AAF364_13545 [Pseudomonadota bacterium]